MLTIKSRIAGIPCYIEILEYVPYVPAYIDGPPEKCHPAEGGYSRWRVLDRRGYPAPWLERKLTDSDRQRINDEIIDHFFWQNPPDPDEIINSML